MCDIINLNKIYNELELEQGDSRRIELQDQYYRGKKSVFIAYLLWFFLGFTGVHKIYLKRYFEAFAHVGVIVGAFIFPTYFIELILLSILFLVVDLFAMVSYANKSHEQYADKLISCYKELV